MNSKVSPWNICLSSANSIADLLREYRNIYTFRRVPVLMTHSAFLICIVHILGLPDPRSASNLAIGVQALREMNDNHRFCSRCLQIVMSLPAQWNKTLPPEVILAAYPETTKPTINGHSAAPHSYTNGTYITPPPPIQGQIHQSDPSQLVSNVSEVPFMAAIRNSPRSTAATSGDLFWSPFPYQSVPLQANQPGGIMDIAAMLDVPNERNQLNRDGFRPNASLADPIYDPQAFTGQNGGWSQG